MFGCYLLEAGSFLMKDRKGVDLEERGGGMGGVVREETNQATLYEKRIYFW